MKKTYLLNNLGCANCAAKMERAICKIDGVQSAVVSFMTSKLTLETNGDISDEIVLKAKAVCSKIEPSCRIIE